MKLRQSKNRRLVIEDSVNEIAHNLSLLFHPFFDPKQGLFIVISVDYTLDVIATPQYLLSLPLCFFNQK